MPMPTAARMPTIELPVDMKTIAETTEASPAIEPTEMSSAPRMITRVCTKARSPMMVIALPISSRLLVRKKFSFSALSRTISAISVMIRLEFCTPIPVSTRRTGETRGVGAAAGSGDIAFSWVGVLMRQSPELLRRPVRFPGSPR